MKTLIMLITLTYALYSGNLITAKQYKYIAETSPSLQNMITLYHTEISKKNRDIVVDFDFTTGGGNEDTGEYENYFETKNGSVPAILSYDQIIVGGKNIALFHREIGADNNENYEETDTTIAGRYTFFNDELDIVLGINYHAEPSFETVGTVEYFSTTLGQKGSSSIVYSVLYHQINLNMLINDEFTPEQTIASYKFITNIGTITPKIVLGLNDDNNYVDTYLAYAYKEGYNDNYQAINAVVKMRYLDDVEDTQRDTATSGYIEFEKMFFLDFFAGVSTTNEFTQENKVGYMLKAGLAVPENLINDLKAQLLWGISNNYYPDLQKVALVDQTMSTINLKIYY